MVEVANPGLILRPGMTASVSVITAEAKDVKRVAPLALRFKPDPQDKDLFHVWNREALADGSSPAERHRLWILDADGAVRCVPVTVGVSDGNNTEIVDGAVQEGERAIVGYLGQSRQSPSTDERSGFGFRFGR